MTPSRTVTDHFEISISVLFSALLTVLINNDLTGVLQANRFSGAKNDTRYIYQAFHDTYTGTRAHLDHIRNRRSNVMTDRDLLKCKGWYALKNEVNLKKSNETVVDEDKHLSADCVERVDGKISRSYCCQGCINPHPSFLSYCYLKTRSTYFKKALSLMF